MARSTSQVGSSSPRGSSSKLVTIWMAALLIGCGEPVPASATSIRADQLPSTTNRSATTATTVAPPPTNAPTTTSIPSPSITADVIEGEGVLMNPLCGEIDTRLLEGALGFAPIEQSLDTPSELRGPGGVLCLFDHGRDRAVVIIELWPPITDDEMFGLLESLPFASEGGMEVSEQNGVWIVETGETQFALIKKVGDRWTSIGLTASPDREFPGLPALEQALDVAAEKLA